MTVNAVVLKNKGVPVEVYRLKENPALGTLDRVVESETEEGYEVFQRQNLFVRFDANLIAELEIEFGSLDGFEQAMSLKGNAAIRFVFSQLLDEDLKLAGKRIIPEEMGRYATAIGVAMSIANGVDPMQAADMLDMGWAQVKKMLAARDEMIRQNIDNARSEGDSANSNGLDDSAKDADGASKSHGTPISETGLEQAAPLPSSGG